MGATNKVPLGIMVETPASAMLAEELAAEADFLSVGTNDLAQYALAADRANAAVSAMLDAFHPAVLRLIRLAAKGCQTHDRWLGVCGGLASDPLAAAILIGLGVTELSAAPAAVPAVKATVRRLRIDQCRALAARACAAASAQGARAIAAEALL
jgi:phosphocarrier protein FPr/phosphocarrier protein